MEQSSTFNFVYLCKHVDQELVKKVSEMQQGVVLSLPDHDPVGVVVVAADGLAVGVFDIKVVAVLSSPKDEGILKIVISPTD